MKANTNRFGKYVVRATAAMLLAATLPASGMAEELPGKGKTVSPGYEGILEGLMETYIVVAGLEKLGYEVKKEALVKPALKYLALAQSDIDFIADAWMPTQESFWEAAGKDSKMTLFGPIVENCAAGYFIDKATADKYKITSIEQLKDPKIAKLFDTDGSGKAALYGCPQGWGCEKRIEHQLDAYGLRDTVRHVQGEMALLAADTIRRYKEGDPVLFFTYMPQWLSQVLVPGRDVAYLTVPFTSLPGGATGNTTLPDGRNIGHVISSISIAANNDFVKENPSAAKFFGLVSIPVADVNAQNYKIYQGESSLEQIRGHADQWIVDHQEEFDAWIVEAKAAAMN